MRRHLFIGFTALLALVPGACTRKEKTTGAREAKPAEVPGVSPKVKLISAVPNGEWSLPAGDHANTRFTPLAQITTENVGRLEVAHATTTGIPRGHEGQPLVVNKTMYVVTPFPNVLIAYDLADPAMPVKWKYDPHPDPESVGKACCDVVNRGASYADGKVIYNLLDGHTIAVDAETGKEVWRAKVGDIDLGETTTMAAQVVKNLVIVGNSGGELGVRGKVVALDVATGKEVWRAYNTGPDADCLIFDDFKPFYESEKGQDLGVKTFPPDFWKTGGATVWGWISYDPEQDLVIYGTGNPGSWNPDLRPGDNKWATSIIARNASDGHMRWAWQATPHDQWDYDEINESVLVDMEWKGQMRKLLLHAGRTGFMYVLDRTTGELLSAEKFEPTNWADGYDLATGRPKKRQEKATHFGEVVKDICPSSTGAKEFAPTAFSPRTGLLYIPAHNTCMEYEGIEANYIAGTPYLGASVKMYPGPGGYQGELVAWDVAAERKVWSIKEEKFPLNGGVLVTGGDVVFWGTMDGWFKAADARTGKELWKHKVSSGVVGNPITYVGPDGKQYVAIYAGIGGWMGAVAFPTISTDDPYAALGVVGTMKDIKKYSAAGDALYVFSL